jgi:NADH-quinone oxidoreductase subunit L
MMQNIIPLIPALPLFGFVLCYLFRKQLSATVAGSIASALVLLPFIASVTLFFTQKSKLEISLFNWISAGTIQVPFSFYIDPLAITMMMIVTGVGFLIHVYSIGYMGHDENAQTFFSYMNLFIFFMLMLVMGANYVMLFIGWEGVGLCSYLLIGFWYKNNSYNLAARKAFIMNRIGDLGFLLGIISLFYFFGTTSFNDVFSKAAGLQSGNSTLTLITILLLIGAIGKSAQIPLFTWLPDAMAGPTPVSALIHAATMVTAGVYLIARSSVLYMLTPFTLDLIILIGLATALFAATIGILQNDIKKVLAYSTVSQLGYMFLALGLGSFSIAMFHVTTHAFFKALLFLGAGSVIHAMGGEQDIRQMGGLKKVLPVTYATFLIGTLAITGIPPLSGFFSKDAILSGAFEHNVWLWIGGLLGALFTCCYMFRLVFLVFGGTFRGSEEQKKHLHESPAVMTVPLIILAVLALSGGFLNTPAILGGHENFSEYLKTSLQGQNFKLSTVPHNVEFLNIGISVILLLCIIWIVWKMYVSKKMVPAPEEVSRKGIVRVVYAKYYVDELYNYVFVKTYESISENILPWFERNIVDGLVNGSGWLMMQCGNVIRRVQNGSINLYLFFMAGGLLAMLIYLLLR